MQKLYSLFTFLIISGFINAQVIVDFESATTWGDFDGGVMTTIANPDSNGNISANVGKLVKNLDKTWGGTSILLASAFDPATTNAVSMKVWSPKTNGKVMLKFEDSTNADNNSGEHYFHVPTASTWTTVIFPLKAINSTFVYDKMVIITDNGVQGDGSANFTYYFDDITAINYTPVDPTAGAVAQPNRAAADVISIFGDSYTTADGLDFDQRWCNANAASVEAQTLTNTTNDEIVNYTGAAACQGMGFTAVDASSFTKLHIDLYIDGEIDMVGKVFNFKFVKASGGEVALNYAFAADYTKDQWVSIDLDLPDMSGYTDVHQIGITCNVPGSALWYDNFYLHKNTTLSTNDISSFDLKLYPNPAIDKINISSIESINQVRIYDISGRIVSKSSPNSSNFNLDIADLNKGVYLVKLNSGDKEATTKFIKN